MSKFKKTKHDSKVVVGELHRSLLGRFVPRSGRARVAIVALLVLLIAGLAGGYWWVRHKRTQTAENTGPTVIQKDVEVYQEFARKEQNQDKKISISIKAALTPLSTYNYQQAANNLEQLRTGEPGVLSNMEFLIDAYDVYATLGNTDKAAEYAKLAVALHNSGVAYIEGYGDEQIKSLEEAAQNVQQ